MQPIVLFFLICAFSRSIMQKQREIAPFNTANQLDILADTVAMKAGGNGIKK